MIVIKSSSNHSWPWSNAGNSAEHIFSKTYPAVYGHLQLFKDRLQKRKDKGQFWWELRSCDYYEYFESPKIIHTDISWRPQFTYTDSPIYLVNTAYLWPTDDLWLLAVVNSPIMWAYMWRNAQHGKDEALRLIYSFIETLPIPKPAASARKKAEIAVSELITLTSENSNAHTEFINWLLHEYGVEKPGKKLESFTTLTADEFITEVKKRRPRSSSRLSPKELTELKNTHADYANPTRARRAQILQLENQISDLVNAAYGLSKKEIALMWETAPPRMPLQPQ